MVSSLEDPDRVQLKGEIGSGMRSQSGSPRIVVSLRSRIFPPCQDTSPEAHLTIRKRPSDLAGPEQKCAWREHGCSMPITTPAIRSNWELS